MLDTFTRVCSHKDDHGILVVGEGNFSFANDLAKYVAEYEKNVSIHATSFDSQQVVCDDRCAEENVKRLQHYKNVFVRHSIDATCLHKFFVDTTFSVIIFNFPHTGGKSNIKKCRRLLEDFFESTCNCLCSEGTVVISLCKGQGGTPVDASRGNYGNSWKVASCASKYGFILRDLLPFDWNSLENYYPAGYRGVICQKFFTFQGLVHVFQKEKTEDETIMQVSENQLQIEELDAILRGKKKMKYVYDSYFKNKTNILYDKLEKIISASIMQTFEELNIKCEDVDWSRILDDSLSNQFTSYNDTIFLSYGTIFDQTLILDEHDHFKMSFYSINNKSVDISPFNCHISHQINFILNTNKTGIDNCGLADLECCILDQIERVLLKGYKTVIVECECNTQDMSKCVCVVDQASKYYEPVVNYSDNSYDVRVVPNFLEDIPLAFWTSFRPQVIISNKNQNDEIEYEEQDYNKYELNKIERNYCRGNILSNVISTNKKIVKKIFANGRCIATIFNYIDAHGHHRLMLTFFTNEVFLLLNVPDLRYLWCSDDVFHACLWDQMNDVEGSACLHSCLQGYQTLIKYPLCYRHDLCFWLDEVHTEEHLIECIRLITINLVHSVRLINVLRHDENSCVSYCYRMIYGRLDGPMSHDDSVKLQNKLRLFLLSQGYVLR